MARYHFGGGCPDPGSFPLAGLAAAAERVLPRLREALCNYPERQGYRPLREIAAARFQRREGVALDPDSFCLTTGSQQAITLVSQALVRSGQPVLVEEFLYSGTLRALRHVGARVIGIPMDDEGMRMDALESRLSELAAAGSSPAFIYTTPTYQNPTGATLSVERRRRMLELARAHAVPIVDDNCYGDLDFDRPAPQTIKALDESDQVILFESFSKIMGPGIRLGCFSCDAARMDQILAHKIDGGTTVLAAAILAEYLHEHLAGHVAEIRQVGRRKRDAVCEALDRYLGVLCSWNRPSGGYFIWVRVPDECDLTELDRLANVAGINYGPGRAFHSGDQPVPYFRLSFAYPSLEEIDAGVAEMARCVRAAPPRRTAVASGAASMAHP
jgi:2-aminoadipate transaminase